MKKIILILITLSSLSLQSQSWWQYANIDTLNTNCNSEIIIDVLSNDSLVAPTDSWNYYPYHPPILVGSDMYYAGNYYCDTCASKNGGSYTIVSDTLIKYIPPTNFVGWDQILYLLSNTYYGSSNHYDSTRVDIYVENCSTGNTLDPEFNKISAYPNPSRDIVHIQFHKNINYDIIRVYDLFGNIFYHKNNHIGDRISINIAEYSTGIYLAEFTQNKKTTRIKFTKL